MEHVNPYAVMRDTATHEAYKAYVRASWKAGQGLMFVGIILPALWVPLQVTIGERFIHRGTPLPLFAAWLIVPAILCLACLAIGGLQVMKFRREHPLPEEWRQVPRIKWPMTPRPLPTSRLKL